MTIEEIRAVLEANEALRTQLIEDVRETPEVKELMNNHAKAYFDANIGSKVSEIYNNLDNDVFETIGERKPTDKKTYEFLKEKLVELKSLKDATSSDKNVVKIKELETKLKALEEDASKSTFWHDTHKSAIEKWEEKEQAYQNQLKEIEQKNVKTFVQMDMSKGLAGLEFNPAVPKSAIDALVRTIESSVGEKAQVKDGKVIYLKDDGTPWLDSNYKPIDAKGIFAEQLGEVLKPKANSGGGAPPEGSKGLIIVDQGGKVAKKLSLDKSKFETKLAFMQLAEKELLAGGVDRNSSDWKEILDAAYKEYKVGELPRT